MTDDGFAAPRATLALLVTRMAGDGARDEAFVRRLSTWLHDHRAHLRLDAVERLGLVDVVLTFRMDGEVTLVVTGRHPAIPGDITLRISEAEFPYVCLVAAVTAGGDPYAVCTLDYSVAGRRVTLRESVVAPDQTYPAGTAGVAVLESTEGAARYVRVRLTHSHATRAINVPAYKVVWSDLCDAPDGEGLRAPASAP